eukprot:1305683-Amphidinium_carterae.1
MSILMGTAVPFWRCDERGECSVQCKKVLVQAQNADTVALPPSCDPVARQRPCKRALNQGLVRALCKDCDGRSTTLLHVHQMSCPVAWEIHAVCFPHDQHPNVSGEVVMRRIHAVMAVAN